MEKRDLICALAGLLTFLSLSAQELKSAKSSLRISNLPRTEVKKIPDTVPPVVEIITPVMVQGTRYQANLKELDLIGKVSDSSGVNFISLNSEMLTPNESGIFTFRLILEPGDNQFRIVAMDKKENLREFIYEATYTPPVVTLADRISSQAKYYGLIIGIDNYTDDAIQNLDNPVKDAQILYGILSSKYNFQEDNIRFLKNATRAEIIRSLDELAQLITPNDNFLIFYAGHGWWDPNANNGYWLPADAGSDEKTNWFRNSTLVDYLKEINSRHTLLITDACFGGSIFKMRSAFGSREKAFEKLYDLPSRKAMTSGTLTEVPDRSYFTRYLFQRLEENQEIYLSSEQLFSSFRLAVINNSDAIPQFGEIDKVGDQGGDFIFLKNLETQIP